MRDQERDVEAAGEETGVQTQVARIAQRDAHLLAKRQMRHRRQARGGACACSVERRSGSTSGIVSSAANAVANIALAQPAAPMMSCTSGANTNCPIEPPALMKPGRERALLGRQTLRGDADQDRETARRGAGRRQHTHGEQQPELDVMNGVSARTERQHDRAGRR